MHMLGFFIDYLYFSRSRDNVGAHQNLNGSRNLTTPLSEMICHRWARTCYELRSTCLPNLKSLSPPATKIWKKIQNVENWMVWS